VAYGLVVDMEGARLKVDPRPITPMAGLPPRDVLEGAVVLHVHYQVMCARWG
jgi:hypothetical protein